MSLEPEPQSNELARTAPPERNALLPAVVAPEPVAVWAEIEPWWTAQDRAYRTVLAVSGGPDSVALVRLTAELLDRDAIPRERFLLGHVQHGLRGAASERDAEFVRGLAAECGFPCEILRIPAGALVAERSAGSRRGASLEGAARDWRYRLLADCASRCGARFVATAHHLDDHIETIAMRLLRGTGIRGLAGVPGARPLAPGITLLRPLRGLRRQQLRDLLGAWSAAACYDASNDDLTLTRNRVRQMLAEWKNEFPWPVEQGLLQLAEQATDLLELLARQTAPLHAALRLRPDGFAISHQTLVPYARCELIHWLQETWLAVGWPQRQMQHATWRELADWLVAPTARPMPILPGRIRAVLEGDQIIVQRPTAASTVPPADA